MLVKPSRFVPQENSVPDLPRLTGIRAVAAFFVVYKHYGALFTILFPLLRPFAFVYRAGPLGVDLFFVLSGFILSHNYLHRFSSIGRKRYLPFLRARFARIYPVHLASLLILTALVLSASMAGKAINPGNYTGREWFQNLFLLQAWPVIFTRGWNFPSWSISAEAFAYVLFPLLAPFLLRTRRPAILCAVALGAFVVPACTRVIPEGFPSNWALLRVSSEFFAGCCLYRLFARRQRCPLTPPVAGALALIVGFACSYFGLAISFAVPVFLFMIWSLAERPTGFLAGRTAQYLGRVSYSLYMTHAVVEIALNRVLPVEHFAGASLSIRLSVFSVYWILIGTLAVGMYHFIEVPARKWLLGAIGRPTAANDSGRTRSPARPEEPVLNYTQAN